MAFAARLGPLATELVEAVVPQTSSAKTQAKQPSLGPTREAILRTLKNHPFLRTNPFEVEKQLDGFEERFRVCHREGLADALRERLDRLRSTPAKWHPEILALLLELSDQPTFHSRLGDLDALRRELDAPVPSLRWEDIAREDGWDEEAEIWESINYSDGSDDEDDYEGRDSKSESDASTASSDPAAVRTAHHLIIHPEDISQFNLARQAQEWRSEKPASDASGHLRKVPVPEFQVARDVLLMLQGLDTTIFRPDGSADPAFQMAHVVWETNKALIGYFSEAGRQLSILRAFVARPQAASHLQALRDSIAMRLANFDRMVSGIEMGLVAPTADVIVSLVAIKAELASGLEPLYALSGIISRVQSAPGSGPFRYLELIFDETASAQLCGRTDVYSFLARIFIECFYVYLRPIRLWMDEGRLIPGDKIFFVAEAPSPISLNKIWQDRFRLRKTPDGSLHVPNFLQPASAKILNAGKNVVVLKQLGQYKTKRSDQSAQEPLLDYDTICPAGFELAPFPDLFNAVFDRWMQSKYGSTSSTLQDALFESCGLWSAVDALENLYFMADGSASEMFSSSLFEKLDSLAPDWGNRYGLTGTAQEAFASLMDPSRISVTVSPEGMRLPVQDARDSVKRGLPTVVAGYRLAWPLQMVLSEDVVDHYQSVFTLQLQLHRALYVLRKRKLLDAYWTDDEDWDTKALYYSLRNSLLWFCTTLQTYLATLVLAPNSIRMRRELGEAQDVDAMISIHTSFMKRVTDEACLGSRLDLIREGFLDMLDLAIKLEQAQLSYQQSRETSEKNTRDNDDDDDDDDDDDSEEDASMEASVPAMEDQASDVLRRIKAAFDKNLRFVCGGLRSVARATSDAQSAKWDILAEMLQTGCRNEA